MIALIGAGLQALAQAEGANGSPAVQQKERIRIFVRGDDFGYTHSSNLAMKQAFDAGIMKSASVMVVGPWFAETAAMIKANPRWTIGLHLTINSEWEELRWGPVLSPEMVPSLVAPDGYFFKNHWTKDKTRSLSTFPSDRRARIEPIITGVLPDPKHVEAELRAQVDRAKRHGIRIDYIDCHMGTACLPEFMPIMQKLSKEMCVPIPENGLLGYKGVGFKVEEDAELTIKNFHDLLISLTPGLYRVVTHPAEDSPELRAVTNIWTDDAKKRDAELHALKSEQVQKLIKARNIEIVSIRDLWDYSSCTPRSN